MLDLDEKGPLMSPEIVDEYGPILSSDDPDPTPVRSYERTTGVAFANCAFSILIILMAFPVLPGLSTTLLLL